MSDVKDTTRDPALIYQTPQLIKVGDATTLIQRKPTGGAADRVAKRDVVAAAKRPAKKKKRK
jgi:hypothetical protein